MKKIVMIAVLVLITGCADHGASTARQQVNTKQTNRASHIHQAAPTRIVTSASSTSTDRGGKSHLTVKQVNQNDLTSDLLNLIQQPGAAPGTSPQQPAGTPSGTRTGAPTTPAGTPAGTPTGNPTGTPAGTPTGTPAGTPANQVPAGTPKNQAPSGTNNQQTPASGDASAYAQQVLDLVNQERSKAGLDALSMDSKLSNMAMAKAKDMYDNKYFDHNSPTHGSPFDMMKEFGITYNSAGENIANGQTSPQQVMQDWMNSPGHKANILNKSYTHIGIAFYNNEWVQEFTG
ncbi:putative YkwD family protein [Paenibacillus rhizosphaerae]|uniref:Putative YkwD family protein n=1 Tax=Paenibacillus rhizosphaerae TaxID=297318 RepID=A0A839THC7_9BACL|nr:CAP domain-containing protein [Paenibacillus rhizosphaerae]MBB3126034.1 putative YkwD family protein [Paenibacillus rhizosphaerae]